MTVMLGPCSWPDPPAELCNSESFGAGVYDEALTAAEAMLFVMTGRQFAGECTDTWRPCTPPHGCGCGGWAGCQCARYPALVLRHQPVTEVTDVVVDGVPLPDTAWVLGEGPDEGKLLRLDGSRWPCCQDPALDTTEVGTWEVVYDWGLAPPAGAGMAKGALACELAQAWTDGNCRLPRRVTSITRENFSAVVLDNWQLFANLQTGLAEVDLWVATWNPGKVDRPPKVLNPDLMGLGVTDPGAARHRTRAMHAGPLGWWP